MTGYLIDSDIVIDFLRNRPAAVQLFRRLGNAQISLSTVAIGEIVHGLEYTERWVQQRLPFEPFLRDATVIPFDLETARIFGRNRARLWKLGRSIHDLDLMIGATAVQHGLTMVTRNIDHFQRIEGIVLFAVDE